MHFVLWFPPEGELWSPMCCHNPGTSAKKGKWQQLPRLPLGWNDPAKQRGQHQHERLTRASAAGGWPECPRAVPSGTFPAAEAHRLMHAPQSHLTLATRRNKSPVAQLVPAAALLLSLLPLELPCLHSEQELSEVWQGCVTRRCTLTHVPAPPPGPASSQEGLRGALGQGKHRQDHLSKDSSAGGTPAALTGVCFTHWGTRAFAPAALRAAGPSSDRSHLLSLFFSRLIPAGRFFLTAFPMLQPSHCLKLLLSEEQPWKV